MLHFLTCKMFHGKGFRQKICVLNPTWHTLSSIHFPIVPVLLSTLQSSHRKWKAADFLPKLKKKKTFEENKKRRKRTFSWASCKVRLIHQAQPCIKWSLLPQHPAACKEPIKNSLAECVWHLVEKKNDPRSYLRKKNQNIPKNSLVKMN